MALDTRVMVNKYMSYTLPRIMWVARTAKLLGYIVDRSQGYDITYTPERDELTFNIGHDPLALGRPEVEAHMIRKYGIAYEPKPTP